MKFGLISDTHGYLDNQVFRYFEEVDEIWHAGDFGSTEVIDQLSNFKPLVGVYGNIDSAAIRKDFPEIQRFKREGMDIMMIHIGGYPPKYNKRLKELLHTQQAPQILICGHSHILKVMSDPKRNNLLYINPGAAGVQGFHKVRTLIRFEIDDGKPHNMEVVELGKRGVLS